MSFLAYLSEIMIPIVIFGILCYAVVSHKHPYDDFITGAKQGIQTVVQIFPTLVGLMIAVGMLRASGFLDFISQNSGEMLGNIGVPVELVPLSLIKMFSSSAATGLLLDIYKSYGTDSFLGFSASLILSSTETIFYTMSLYFMTVKVTKTRYTLAGALVASLAGILASICIARVCVW